MSGLEVVGLVFASANALLNTISALEKSREARKELPQEAHRANARIC